MVENVEDMKIDVQMVSAQTGKRADVELVFTAGIFAGMKWVGFAVWESRPGRFTVTFPARTYASHGERRSYALLRPVATMDGTERLRELIVAAYHDAVTRAAEAAS